MNNTPNYQKWFNGSSAVPAAEIETTTVVPGQVLAGNSDNRNQAPPTNGESDDYTETVKIPWVENEQGKPKSIFANLQVSYRVEDWGDVWLDNQLLIDLTSREEGTTGQWGGHTAWKKSNSATISSGEHTQKKSCLILSIKK